MKQPTIQITGFTEKEIETLRKEAKEQSLSLSAYCRRKILGL